jgi:hypothetical protein
MDPGLFAKHFFQIKKAHDIKNEVLVYIQEKTGVELFSEEVMITKKKVTIQTSSVKRMILIQKNIKKLLEEKGYTFNS